MDSQGVTDRCGKMDDLEIHTDRNPCEILFCVRQSSGIIIRIGYVNYVIPIRTIIGVLIVVVDVNDTIMIDVENCGASTNSRQSHQPGKLSFSRKSIFLLLLIFGPPVCAYVGGNNNQYKRKSTDC